jgi:hypothetical protein
VCCWGHGWWFPNPDLGPVCAAGTMVGGGGNPNPDLGPVCAAGTIVGGGSNLQPRPRSSVCCWWKAMLVLSGHASIYGQLVKNIHHNNFQFDIYRSS